MQIHPREVRCLGSQLGAGAVALVSIGVLLSVSQVRADDAALGEYLSSQCTTCHQLSGGVTGIPSIIGWDEASFRAVMQSYRNKERENQAMQNIAVTLSDEDIAALAAYFGSVNE
ncbi:MAG: c-type cytochrome [Hyphomicrobiaceae bacterium]